MDGRSASMEVFVTRRTAIDSLGTRLQLEAIPVSKVFAVAAGNALEFYDFLTFSFFAIQIGHLLFPRLTDIAWTALFAGCFWGGISNASYRQRGDRVLRGSSGP